MEYPLREAKHIAQRMSPQVQGFRERYAQLSDEEVIRLADQRADLTDLALEALNHELLRRKLGENPLDQSTVRTQETKENDISGVKGWLALLAFVLTVGSPVATILHLFLLFVSLRVSAVTSGLQFELLGPNIFAFLADPAIVIGFGIYAGIGLYRRKPNAISIVKRYLVSRIVIGLIHIVNSAYAINSEDLARNGIQSIVVSIIWYAYLVKSKRVAATFGSFRN
jgi:hypothetical protein